MCNDFNSIQSPLADDQAFYKMALQHHQNGDGALAIQQLLKALQANPQNPLYYAHLGQWIHHYQVFQPTWCRNLGHFYQQQGQLEQATDWYTLGQQMQPENPQWSRYLGVIAYEQGQLEEALDCFKTAQAKGVNDPELWYNLGTLSFLTEQFQAAWRCFLQVYTTQTGREIPDFATTHHPLNQFHDYLLSCALFYWLNGQRATASILFDQIERENPQHNTMFQLLRVLNAQDQPD